LTQWTAFRAKLASQLSTGLSKKKYATHSHIPDAAGYDWTRSGAV
jgi:hypothetical protein